MAKRRPQPRDLSEQSLETRRKALEALAQMRDLGLSPTQAAKRVGTTIRTMKKYLGPTLQRQENGRYQARPTDRLARRVRFLTPTGNIALTVKDSRVASKIARHQSAVNQYLRGKGTEALGTFEKRFVTVDGVQYAFITDPETIEQLANAGEVSFEDLYVETIA